MTVKSQWTYQFVKTALHIEGTLKGDHDYVVAYRDRVFIFNPSGEKVSGVSGDFMQMQDEDLLIVADAARFIVSFEKKDFGDDINETELFVKSVEEDPWMLISHIRDKRPDVIVGYVEDNRFVPANTTYFFHSRGSRLLQNILKELGLDGISLHGESGEYESYPSAEVTGDLPKLLYHGTTSAYAMRILRFGLMADESETNHKEIDHPNTVFLHSDISNASHHAQNASAILKNHWEETQYRGFPVVFQFEIPDPSLLKPDWDVDNMVSREELFPTYPNIAPPQHRMFDVDDDPFKLTKKLGVYGYGGRIPANFIRDMWIKMEDYNDENAREYDPTSWQRVTPEEMHKALDHGMPEGAFYEDQEDLCDGCSNEISDCVCENEEMTDLAQSQWTYKYAYENIEQLYLRPYTSIGHPGIAWLLDPNSGEVLTGESHYHICLDKLVPLYGRGSDKILSTAWYGRHSLDEDIVSISGGESKIHSYSEGKTDLTEFVPSVLVGALQRVFAPTAFVLLGKFMNFVFDGNGQLHELGSDIDIDEEDVMPEEEKSLIASMLAPGGSFLRYKYASDDSNVFHWIGKNWRFTIPLTVFMGWYASAGGTLNGLAEEIKSGKDLPEIVQSISAPEMSMETETEIPTEMSMETEIPTEMSMETEIPPEMPVPEMAEPIEPLVKNNNPGNIEIGNDQWQGMSESQEGRFVSFDTPEYGLRAMARVLRKYQGYGINTIEGIINRWAPPSDHNPTAQYIENVSDWTGFEPNQPLDLQNTDHLMLIMKAMIRQEHGQNPYDDQAILRGIELEKGKSMERTAFNYDDKTKAKGILYALMSIHGDNWGPIGKGLHDQGIPETLMGWLNNLFLTHFSTSASRIDQNTWKMVLS